MFGLRSGKDVMERFQGCGNGLVQLEIWRVVSGDARADVFHGAFTMSAAVLFLAVMVDPRWCSKSGKRDGRSIDSPLGSFILFESLILHFYRAGWAIISLCIARAGGMWIWVWSADGYGMIPRR